MTISGEITQILIGEICISLKKIILVTACLYFDLICLCVGSCVELKIYISRNYIFKGRSNHFIHACF